MEKEILKMSNLKQHIEESGRELKNSFLEKSGLKGKYGEIMLNDLLTVLQTSLIEKIVEMVDKYNSEMIARYWIDKREKSANEVILDIKSLLLEALKK